MRIALPGSGALTRPGVGEATTGRGRRGAGPRVGRIASGAPRRRRPRSAPSTTVSETCCSSSTTSLSRRTRSFGTARFSTTASSAWSVTSCSSSEIAGPSVASSTLASVIGSRSTRTSSRARGPSSATSSVTTYLRRRARPVSRSAVPTESSSSERVIASSVVGPDVSRPTGSSLPPAPLPSSPPSGRPAAGLRVVVPEAVVLVQRPLLGARELPVRVDVRRVLDVRLLERDLHPVTRRVGLLQRHEGALAAEQPGLDERPLGLVGVGVEVDLLDRCRSSRRRCRGAPGPSIRSRSAWSCVVLPSCRSCGGNGCLPCRRRRRRAGFRARRRRGRSGRPW